MDITTLENWLWEAACSIRGPLDAPKYKDYILPLLFYKRLCDVFADEVDRLSREFGDMAQELIESDRGLIRFYIPPEHTWDQVRHSPVELGQRPREPQKLQAVSIANLWLAVRRHQP
ncbi:MAG: hypothetical protein Kow0063_13950 [Anaerolineae bacterium]